MNTYKQGRREFSEFLSNNGIRLRRTVDRGLQRDGYGWEHFAWELHVSGPDTETYAFPYRQGLAHAKRPTLADIMAALFNDARCTRGTFDEFCDDLGYDSDSLKARNMFDACTVSNGQLLRLFRVTDLDALLARVEPLLERAGL